MEFLLKVTMVPYLAGALYHSVRKGGRCGAGGKEELWCWFFIPSFFFTFFGNECNLGSTWSIFCPLPPSPPFFTFYLFLLFFLFSLSFFLLSSTLSFSLFLLFPSFLLFSSPTSPIYWTLGAHGRSPGQRSSSRIYFCVSITLLSSQGFWPLSWLGLMEAERSGKDWELSFSLMHQLCLVRKRSMIWVNL